MKLVESNARIETKLDHVDGSISELKRGAGYMEQRLDQVEQGLALIKQKTMIVVSLVSGAVSLSIPFLIKIFGGE